MSKTSNTKNTKINTLFLLTIFTLNLFLISCSLQTQKLSVNKNILEIKSEPEFYDEVKNCIKSFSEGTFIHYDYSDDEKEEETLETEDSDLDEDRDEDNEEENDEEVTEENHKADAYAIQKDLDDLKQIEENIELYKQGKISEEELKKNSLKVDQIMKKYDTKKDLNDLSKTEEISATPNINSSNEADSDEYYDEENQNSMIKMYVSEKLDETKDVESTAFDKEMKLTVIKLNIMKLLTYESEVQVNLAAAF